MRIGATLALALGITVVGGMRSEAADVRSEPVVEAVLVQQPVFQVSLTPYFWMASVNGTITIDSIRRPGASVSADFDASFDRIFSSLDGVPFVGAGEIRYGRLGLAFDLIYVPLAQDFATPFDLFFRGGEATLRQTLGQAVLAYRIYEDATQSIDVGAGARYYEFRTTLNLNPGLLPGESASRTFSWTDPIIAARYHVQFAPQWGFSLYGDIGGFGAGSELSWQILGTIDYRVTQNIDLRVGYRHLSFERREARGVLDLDMTGPIIGATFRF